MKITAKGSMGGKIVTVVFEDGEFNIHDLWLTTLLQMPEPLGGTYYPEPNDPINVYYTLKDRYFDKLESIEVEGELGTIPQPDGADGVY